MSILDHTEGSLLLCLSSFDMTKNIHSLWANKWINKVLTDWLSKTHCNILSVMFKYSQCLWPGLWESYRQGPVSRDLTQVIQSLDLTTSWINILILSLGKSNISYHWATSMLHWAVKACALTLWSWCSPVSTLHWNPPLLIDRVVRVIGNPCYRSFALSLSVSADLAAPSTKP